MQPAFGPGTWKYGGCGGVGHANPGPGPGRRTPTSVGGRNRQTAAGMAARPPGGPRQGYQDTWAPEGEPSTGPTGGRGRCWLRLWPTRRLLELSRQAQGELPEDSAERQGICRNCWGSCCSRTWSGPMTEWAYKPQGWGEPGNRLGARPGMRHGRKAAADASTDTRRRLWWTPIPSYHRRGGIALATRRTGGAGTVEADATGVTVEETMGDAAYGDGATR